jgi:hypothetical protein
MSFPILKLKYPQPQAMKDKQILIDKNIPGIFLSGV